VRLLARLGVALPCITLGARGALLLHGGELLQVPAPRVEVVDTTGAGDGFVAGLLSVLAAPGLPGPRQLPRADLMRALQRGCAVGSRVCTALGAVTALPRLAELGPA
jgi:fructokinase